jgi:hypothetical protein
MRLKPAEKENESSFAPSDLGPRAGDSPEESWRDGREDRRNRAKDPHYCEVSH